MCKSNNVVRKWETVISAPLLNSPHHLAPRGLSLRPRPLTQQVDTQSQGLSSVSCLRAGITGPS